MVEQMYAYFFFISHTDAHLNINIFPTYKALGSRDGCYSKAYDVSIMSCT